MLVGIILLAIFTMISIIKSESADTGHKKSKGHILGKSGSGKSYAVKTLLAHLASTDTKIFILDPDGEYKKLTDSLAGKVLDVASSKYGKLNPFQVITSLDDENDDGTNNGFFQHLQFLEEFFRLILDGINADCFELINKKVLELYVRKGITGESDFTKLAPESNNIVYNPCGQAFLMSTPSSRTNVKIIATPFVENLFKEENT